MRTATEMMLDENNRVRGPLVFVITGSYQLYRDYCRMRNLSTKNMTYRYLESVNSLMGYHPNRIKIICTAAWLRVPLRTLSEIFHWARYAQVKIETGPFEVEAEYYLMFKEADPEKDYLKQSLTKIFLSDDELHNFVMDNLNYNKEEKNLLLVSAHSKLSHTSLMHIGKLWETLINYTKASKGIDGVYSRITDEVTSHRYLNNGKTLPRLDREITQDDLYELVSNPHEPFTRTSNAPIFW